MSGINISQIHKLLFNDLLDFLYPPICIVTSNKLPKSNSNNFVDDNILKSLTTIDKHSLNQISAKLLCDKVISLFRFEDGSDLQTIIHHLKYTKMSKLGFVLGSLLASELSTLDEIGSYVLLPVPLHKLKEKERGYNQSEFIARGISKVLNIDVNVDLVKRTKYTQSQTKLNQTERELNVMDAFTLTNPQKSSHDVKNVIIIDDVITTGATINEVTKVLRNKTGINKIVAASIAIAH